MAAGHSPEKLSAGRKVRAPQDKVLGNAQSRRRAGKCHRKQTAQHSTLRGYLWRAGFSQYLDNLVNHLDTPSELSAG